MHKQSFYTYYTAPFGQLLLTSDGESLTGIFPPGNSHYEVEANGTEDDAPFEEVVAQLDEYFAGKRKNFDLPLSAEGTEFQQRVWEALKGIPYGKTASYKGIAERITMPKASRAVGSANGKNPICIIIPCHRVIASGGGLGGYNGGLDIKRWLLSPRTSRIRRFR